MDFADFFCGIGGIRLGFENNGFNCVFSNDIDKYAIKVYENNFRDKVCNTSIENLENIPNFDIFVGGFPCQAFSIAGKQMGFQDERGNLFFSIIRILKEKQPSCFLLENVKNLVTHDKKQTFRRIKKELRNAGYFFKWKILNACKYGNIPQNRERIFIVGFNNKENAIKFKFPKEIKLTNKITDYLEDAANKYYYKQTDKIYPILEENVLSHVNTNQVYQFRRHYVRENKSGLCPTLTANMGGGGHNVPIILDDKGIRKLTPKECFNLQGFPRNFLLEGSDTQLYKQAGNSVCVPVIYRIAKEIKKVLFSTLVFE